MQLLLELSRYLRSSFDFQNRDQLVPLHKELELVQAYLYLEQARFEERLEVQYDIVEQGFIMIPRSASSRLLRMQSGMALCSAVKEVRS